MQQTLQGLIRSDEFHKRLHTQIERIRGVMEETLGFAINLECNDPELSLKKCAEQFVQSVSELPGTANDRLGAYSLPSLICNRRWMKKCDVSVSLAPPRMMIAVSWLSNFATCSEHSAI